MEALRIADALAMAGVNRTVWNDMVSHGFYTEAPPTKTGQRRFLDRDDIVSLFVLDHFSRLGGGPAMAARVASAIRKELRKGAEIDRLWVVCTAADVPRRVVSVEPPADMIRHEIPIAELRLKIERLAAERGFWRAG